LREIEREKERDLMDESKTNGYIALREIVIEKREIRLGIV